MCTLFITYLQNFLQRTDKLARVAKFKLNEVFCPLRYGYPRLWLGLSLAVLQYFIYFRFYGYS